MVRARETSAQLLKNKARDTVQAELHRKLEEAQRDYDDLLAMIRHQEANMRETFELELQAMAERHDTELNALDCKWTSPERERKYNRTSSLLRILRSQAALLLKDHKYEESRFVDSRADGLERAETDEGHRRMEADYLYQLGVLEQRHDREADELLRRQSVRRGEYEAAKDFDVGVAQKRIENIQRQIDELTDPERVWALYHRYDTDPIVTRDPGVLHKRALVAAEYTTLALPPLRTSAIAKKSYKRFNRTQPLGC
jgi:hypothetical protein